MRGRDTAQWRRGRGEREGASETGGARAAEAGGARIGGR